MSTATTASPIQREPELLGQTVVVIGGSAGIGLETARRARAEGAERHPYWPRSRPPAARRDRARRAEYRGLRRHRSCVARAVLRRPAGPIDHVMVTAGGPTTAALLDMDFDQARRALDAHLLLALQVARHAAGKVRPGGTLLFMGGTGARRPGSVSRSFRLSPPRSPPSWPTSRSSSRPSASTSLPPASSTRRCRHRCSATSSKTAAISFAPRFPSGASSARPTSPRSPFTS